jgi:hypothetical protein
MENEKNETGDMKHKNTEGEATPRRRCHQGGRAFPTHPPTPLPLSGCARLRSAALRRVRVSSMAATPRPEGDCHQVVEIALEELVRNEAVQGDMLHTLKGFGSARRKTSWSMHSSFGEQCASRSGYRRSVFPPGLEKPLCCPESVLLFVTELIQTVHQGSPRTRRMWNPGSSHTDNLLGSGYHQYSWCST